MACHEGSQKAEGKGGRGYAPPSALAPDDDHSRKRMASDASVERGRQMVESYSILIVLTPPFAVNLRQNISFPSETCVYNRQIHSRLIQVEIVGCRRNNLGNSTQHDARVAGIPRRRRLVLFLFSSFSLPLSLPLLIPVCKKKDKIK